MPGKSRRTRWNKRFDQDHADRRRHSEGDPPAGAPFAAFRSDLQPADLFQQRAAVFQHRAADFGQFRAASVAPQQRRAALRLQLADMSAQRRLRDAEMARGQGETAELADADEISEPLEIHANARPMPKWA